MSWQRPQLSWSKGSELGVGAALISVVMNSLKAAVMSVGETKIGEASSFRFFLNRIRVES